MALSEYLLEKGVAVVPGSAFGAATVSCTRTRSPTASPFGCWSRAGRRPYWTRKGEG